MLKPTEKIKQLSKLVEEVAPYVESQAEKKQEVFNKRSDDWQWSEKGMDTQEDINNLTELQQSLDDLRWKLTETYEL